MVPQKAAQGGMATMGWKLKALTLDSNVNRVVYIEYGRHMIICYAKNVARLRQKAMCARAQHAQLPAIGR